MKLSDLESGYRVFMESGECYLLVGSNLNMNCKNSLSENQPCIGELYTEDFLIKECYKKIIPTRHFKIVKIEDRSRKIVFNRYDEYQDKPWDSLRVGDVVEFSDDLITWYKDVFIEYREENGGGFHTEIDIWKYAKPIYSNEYAVCADTKESANLSDTTKENEDIDVVNKAEHYNKGKIEVIDLLENIGFNKDCYMFNYAKYVLRCKYKKNMLEDLKKAEWYLKRKLKNIETQNDKHFVGYRQTTYDIDDILDSIGVKQDVSHYITDDGGVDFMLILMVTTMLRVCELRIDAFRIIELKNLLKYTKDCIERARF